jgi:hypothetical protein
MSSDNFILCANASFAPCSRKIDTPNKSFSHFPYKRHIKTIFKFRFYKCYISFANTGNKQYTLQFHQFLVQLTRPFLLDERQLITEAFVHRSSTVKSWWEINPRMGKKVPSTSLPQHTSRASLVSAEKNHVGYFRNSPRTPVAFLFHVFKWNKLSIYILIQNN